MEFLSKGRLTPCVDAKSGVKSIRLAKRRKTPFYTFDNNGIVTFTADVEFYKFESNNIDYTKAIRHEDEGEIYEVNIGFDMFKVDKDTSETVNTLSDLLLVAIVQDEYDIYHVFGLESGLDININETSGGSKSGFSGYNIKLKGFQERSGYFVNSVEPITPEPWKFVLMPNGVTIKYLGNTVGDTGQAIGDTSGKVYTAVDNTTIRLLDPETDDFTSVCTTLCTDLDGLFDGESLFNQDISNWDTSNVTSLDRTFRNASTFNQNISFWDVKSVTNMISTFNNADSFNQPIGIWNVGKVTMFTGCFNNNSVFNQSLNNWDVSSAINMDFMFRNSVFNQPLNNWNTSNVISMHEMFNSATAFNQDLSSWCVENIPTEPTGFANNTPQWIEPKPNWGDPC